MTPTIIILTEQPPDEAMAHFLKELSCFMKTQKLSTPGGVGNTCGCQSPQQPASKQGSSASSTPPSFLRIPPETIRKRVEDYEGRIDPSPAGVVQQDPNSVTVTRGIGPVEPVEYEDNEGDPEENSS